MMDNLLWNFVELINIKRVWNLAREYYCMKDMGEEDSAEPDLQMRCVYEARINICTEKQTEN